MVTPRKLPYCGRSRRLLGPRCRAATPRASPTGLRTPTGVCRSSRPLAAVPKVDGDTLGTFRVVVEISDSTVAAYTQQAPHFARCVVVIDMQPPPPASRGVSAYLTTIPNALNPGVYLLGRQPVFPLQPSVPLLGLDAVPVLRIGPPPRFGVSLWVCSDPRAMASPLPLPS